MSESMPFWTSCSVLVSIEDVASSSIRAGGLATAARAIDSAGGIVEYQHLRLFEQSPGDAKAL